MAIQTIDLGRAMRFVTHRAGNFTQMRLMRIAVFKIGRLCFLHQLIHRTMTFKTLFVFHGGIECGQIFPMTIPAGQTFNLFHIHDPKFT